jgi:uncharacterized membrane protein
MNILLLALILAYPVAAHATVSAEFPWAPWLLSAIALVEAARRARRHPAASAILVLLAAVLALTATKFTDTLIRLPPVLVPLMLGAVFALSLMPGHKALVTRFVELTEGRAPEDVCRYTRALTWVWTLLFLVLALEATLLGLFATPQLWSLFTNGLNYLFVAIVFVVEFAIRRRRFPERARGGLLASVGRIARDWRRLRAHDATKR